MLDDAVATQDTVTQLVPTIRRVRRLIPAAGGARAGRLMTTTRPGKPACAWDDRDARDELVTGLVNDARASSTPSTASTLDDEQADAVGLLALVAGQDVEPGDSDGSWRIARRTATDRVISTVDPETRHMHKSVSNYRDGYKAHLASNPRPGSSPPALTAGQRRRRPGRCRAAGRRTTATSGARRLAYGSGPTRAALRRRRHRLVIKPGRRADTGRFGRDDFHIDHQPAPSPARPAHRHPHRRQQRHLRAALQRLSAAITLHHRPQRPQPRDSTVHDAELVEARRAWRDGDFAADYRQWRPMVERTLAWLVATRHRRVPYRGIDRNRIWLAHRAAAINLQRLINLGLTHTERWKLAT